MTTHRTRCTHVAHDARVTIVGVVGFAVAVAAASQIAIPLPCTPVPITLQPMLVILAGMMLGPVAGAASMVLYLVAGAAGLAGVHADGRAGHRALLRADGRLSHRVSGRGVRRGSARVARFVDRSDAWLAGLAGIAVIYLGGIAQLAVLSGSVARAIAARRDAVRGARSREGVRRGADQSAARPTRPSRVERSTQLSSTRRQGRFARPGVLSSSLSRRSWRQLIGSAMFGAVRQDSLCARSGAAGHGAAYGSRRSRLLAATAFCVRVVDQQPWSDVWLGRDAARPGLLCGRLCDRRARDRGAHRAAHSRRLVARRRRRRRLVVDRDAAGHARS